MKYKRWSLKKKHEILEQAKEFGVVETCRKFSVKHLLISKKMIFIINV